MRTERPSSLRADLALLGVTAIWGFTFPAVQLALREVQPLVFLSARFALAMVALLVVFRGRVFRIGARGLIAACLLGACLAAGSILQTYGLRLTTSSKSAFITALYVVIVPLLVALAERVRLRPSSVLAVVLATGGLYLVTRPSVDGFNLGDLLTLGCAFAFAFHILITEAAAPRHDAVALNFWQIAITTAICATAMAPSGRPALPLTFWTITALAVTGLLATALAFGVQIWAQRDTSATHAAIVFTGEPVFAALFSGMIQGQWLDGPAVLGAGLIVGGMLIAQIRAGPAPAITPDK